MAAFCIMLMRKRFSAKVENTLLRCSSAMNEKSLAEKRQEQHLLAFPDDDGRQEVGVGIGRNHRAALAGVDKRAHFERNVFVLNGLDGFGVDHARPVVGHLDGFVKRQLTQEM
jgi:hypothetical protein